MDGTSSSADDEVTGNRSKVFVEQHSGKLCSDDSLSSGGRKSPRCGPEGSSRSSSPRSDRDAKNSENSDVSSGEHSWCEISQAEETQQAFVLDAPVKTSIEEHSMGGASRPIYSKHANGPDGRTVPAPPTPSPSRTTSISSCSGCVVQSPPQQESGQWEGSQSVKLWRMRIVKDIIKKSAQPCYEKKMKVPIPKEFSGNISSHADLLVSYFPYQKEYTDWPKRFFHLRLQLKIPPQFVHSMTFNYACWLVLRLSVTSSGYNTEPNDVLENNCAQEKEVPLPKSTENFHYSFITTLRHSVLIDSNHDRLHFNLTAKFKNEKREINFGFNESYEHRYVVITPNK